MNYLNIYVWIHICYANTIWTKTIDMRKYLPDEHLKLENIKNLCAHRQNICNSNDKRVCAVRVLNVIEYKDFNNSCILFMANMCEYPDKEYSIITSGSCLEYLKTRRMHIPNTNATTVRPVYNKTGKPLLRSETTFQTLYEVDTAFDYHVCPLSCPDVYSPVCVGVNRGFGMYFKLFTFANHCLGDLYYCKNWKEFSPPPDEDEMIRSSPLSWSFCAANRYIQFARFSELTSSMGHYGWLAGGYRPSHIIEPHQRYPGYG